MRIELTWRALQALGNSQGLHGLFRVFVHILCTFAGFFMLERCFWPDTISISTLPIGGAAWVASWRKADPHGVV